MRRNPYQPAPRYRRCPICGRYIIPRTNPRNVNPYDASVPRIKCKCYER